MRTYKLTIPLFCLALLAGCANLAPDYARPELPVPASLDGSAAVGTAAAAPLNWQQVVTDALDLPSDLATQLQEAWEHAVTDDVAAGRTPNVLAFTYAMVDASFPQED